MGNNSLMVPSLPCSSCVVRLNELCAKMNKCVYGICGIISQCMCDNNEVAQGWSMCTCL